MSQNRRWIALSFFVFGVLLWIMVDKFLDTIMGWFGVAEFNFELPSERFTLTTLVGLIVAAVTGWRFWTSKHYSGLLNEVAVELRKVTWPNAQETRAATVVVIITVFIMAFFLGVFDFFWSSVMDWLYPSVQSG